MTLAAFHGNRSQKWILLCAISVVVGYGLRGASIPCTKRVTSYAITSANDRPERDPKDWLLLGSNDGGKTWTVLDERKGEVFSSRLERREFTIRSPVACNTYRLQIDSVSMPAVADSVQLAELELIGGDAPSNGQGKAMDLMVRAAGEDHPAECASYAFDHRPETKWLDFALQSPHTKASWIEVHYVPAAPEITNLSTLICVQPGANQRTRPVRIEGIVGGVDRIGKRIVLVDVTGSMSVPLGDDAQWKVGMPVLLTGKSAWVEHRQARGPPLVEPTIIEPIVKLLEETVSQPTKPRDYESVVARAATNARIVVHYALTSANDHQGRDPSAWRLLGSNDKGRTWTTLDQRKEQSFPLRFQRRVFSTTNNEAFNMYRLQIDSTFGGPSESAVQLAEWELISPAEEDQRLARLAAPFFSARGENLPHEGAAAAFDANAETKWLDFTFGHPGSSWLQVQYLSLGTKITNIAQLKEFAHQRSLQGLLVHIEGTIASFDARRKEFYLLDDTGGLHIPAGWVAGKVRPGQEVMLDGQSAVLEEPEPGQAKFREWVGEQPRITILDNLAPDPESIRPGQAMGGRSLFRSARVAGALRFVSQSDDGAVLELTDGNGRISVICFGADASQFTRYLNMRLQARGVCEGILDEQGTQVAGRLWAPDSESVSLVEPTDNEWNAFPLTPIGRLHASLRTFPEAVRVRGIATQSGSDTEILLSEDSHDVRVQVATAGTLATGSQVEALGFLGWREQTPVLQQAYCRMVATNGDGQSGQMLLTRVEQILRLPPSEQELWYDARIRGVITSDRGYVNDQSAGIYVQRLKEWGGKAGDFVEVFGHAGSGQMFGAKSYTPVLGADGVRVLGRGRWPEPKTFSWNYLMTGQPAGQWIEVTGVGRAANRNILTLAVEGGKLAATVAGATAEDMDGWIDASLRLRGVYQADINQDGQFLGFSLDVPAIDCVQIEKRPPLDPFAVPVRKAATLLNYDPLEKLTHRRKIAGIVLHADERSFYLQDSSGGLQVRPRKSALVHPGDMVEAVGFPESRRFSPTLAEALVRTTGMQHLPEPARITLDEILRGEREGSWVTLKATLVGQKTADSGPILELQSEQQNFRALLKKADLGTVTYPPGSTVDLHGVFRADRSLDESGTQRVSAFEFLLNDAHDVVLLARPPWWTFKRTAWLLGSLGAVLFGALAWIRTLRLKVEQRSKELLEEIAERGRAEENLKAEIAERKRAEVEVEKAQKALLDTARRAGMAEVATSVLHNVGNVLNSINVTATVIDDLVRRSRASDLSRLAKLLDERRADLAAFLSQDKRGQRVPDYVAHLSETLAREQSTMRAEVLSLRKNVAHVKDIVAMQQSYGKVSGLIETVQVTELIEDTLRMNAGSFERHDVRVIRDYERVPLISTDKHKVIQILVNLIRNAKAACDESRHNDKQICVRVRNGDSVVQVLVIDNGVGVPGENLTRIFNHGFTTRTDGHGFGLHSGALAAKELGGSLTVQSEGLDKGATFVLELPKPNGPSPIPPTVGINVPARSA